LIQINDNNFNVYHIIKSYYCHQYC